MRRSYGEHPDQHVDVYAPTGARGAVVAVLHGGFWRTPYAADLMDPLCADLAARGYEAWNVEYRRIGADGGWPMTFDDVRAAVTGAEEPFVTLGHSAGGQLALWLAAERGAALAVAQAGVVDLVEAWRLGLSGRAPEALLAAPRTRSPTGTRSPRRRHGCRSASPSFSSTGAATIRCPPR